MSFEQAAIKVEKQREFETLHAAIDRVFCAAKVEKFLNRMQRKGLRVRDFDLMLASGLLEDVDETLARSGKTARQWYQELALSDQAQMREFYLSRLEQVAPELREKFSKLYAYY